MKTLGKPRQKICQMPCRETNKTKQGRTREDMGQQGKMMETLKKLETASHAGLASLASWAKNITQNLQRKNI